MGFTKYQHTEKTEVVSPKGHRKIEDALQKQGKKSLSQVSDQDRARITSAIDPE